MERTTPVGLVRCLRVCRLLCEFVESAGKGWADNVGDHKHEEVYEGACSHGPFESAKNDVGLGCLEDVGGVLRDIPDA